MSDRYKAYLTNKTFKFFFAKYCITNCSTASLQSNKQIDKQQRLGFMKMKKILKNITDNYNDNNNSRLTILSLINQLPGVRYSDLARITKHNNGVISHYLCTLEKSYCIKAIRCSNGKITRYFSISIGDKYYPVIGYLKNETTRKIILFLYYNGESNFKKIQLHINKASSTTFWNLKKLVDDNIIVRLKTKKK